MAPQKTTKAEKFAFIIVIISILLMLGLIVLFGWGFIQIIQWITSK